MPAKKFCIQTIFAFMLLLMPAVALVPQDSLYQRCDFFYYYSEATLVCTGHAKELFNLDYFRQHTESLFPDFKKTTGLLIMAEPPLSAPFIIPIAIIPIAYAYYIWQFVLLVCLSVSLALWTQMFRFSDRQFLLAAVVVTLSGPIYEVIRVAKPTALVFLCWTVAVWFWQRKQFIGAGILFAPWTLKPQQMMPFIALMTGARQFKFVLGIVLVTLGLFLASLAIFGFDIYPQWLRALAISQEHPELTSPSLHPVLRGQLLRLLGMDAKVVAHIITPIVAVAYLSALFLLAYLGHRFRKCPDLIKLTVACIPLGIVTSPYCQNYDLILLIPSVLAFFKLGALNSLHKAIRIICLVVVAACLLVFELPFYTFIHYTYLQHGLLAINPFFVSLCLLSAIFIWASVRASKVPQAELG
jgi:hypothetical protein